MKAWDMYNLQSYRMITVGEDQTLNIGTINQSKIQERKQALKSLKY